jgi:hypothetical protein
MRICFSSHGNVAFFEAPAGNYFIGGREGYVACAFDTSGNVFRAYDAGPWESGWSPPTIAQPNGTNTFPLTITRRTTNNWMELKQTFSRDTTEFDVTITMTLKNTSGKTLFVNLDRYADWDVSPNSGDDYTRTTDFTVEAWDSSLRRPAISLSTSATDNPWAYYESYFNWYSSTLGGCEAGNWSNLAGAGDFVGRISHTLGGMAAGASKTFRVFYRTY